MPVVCGWLRRAFSRPARLRRAQSPVRTSPLASELPLTCEALPFAGAALPLTCRAAPANPSSFAALTTPGGLRSLRSASSLSFLVILLPQNNSLTFVRGADRACCAPRKKQRSLTYAPRKWPLGLLYCINGFADQPMLACTSPRTPRRGIGGRTRQRHLAATLPPPCRPRLLCAA